MLEQLALSQGVPVIRLAASGCTTIDISGKSPASHPIHHSHVTYKHRAVYVGSVIDNNYKMMQMSGFHPVWGTGGKLPPQTPKLPPQTLKLSPLNICIKITAIHKIKLLIFCFWLKSYVQQSGGIKKFSQKNIPKPF